MDGKNNCQNQKDITHKGRLMEMIGIDNQEETIGMSDMSLGKVCQVKQDTWMCLHQHTPELPTQ
jgi:hypothetical protein